MRSLLIFFSVIYAWSAALGVNPAETFLKNKPVRFLENRGQLSDMAGNPVPFILYKASANGIDLYVTDKGLTYVLHEFREADRDEREDNDVGPEKCELSWEKIRMELVGAN